MDSAFFGFRLATCFPSSAPTARYGVEEFSCTSPLVWGSGDVENLFRVLCCDGLEDFVDHVGLGYGVVGFCEGIHQRVVADTSAEVSENDSHFRTRW